MNGMTVASAQVPRHRQGAPPTLPTAPGLQGSAAIGTTPIPDEDSRVQELAAQLEQLDLQQRLDDRGADPEQETISFVEIDSPWEQGDPASVIVGKQRKTGTVIAVESHRLRVQLNGSADPVWAPVYTAKRLQESKVASTDWGHIMQYTHDYYSEIMRDRSTEVYEGWERGVSGG